MNSENDYTEKDNETKPVAQNWNSAQRKSGRAEDQTYIDASKPHGVDVNDAHNDMWEAMMTPGGFLKKTLDSTYPSQDAVSQNIANLSNSQNGDNDDDVANVD